MFQLAMRPTPCLKMKLGWILAHTILIMNKKSSPNLVPGTYYPEWLCWALLILWLTVCGRDPLPILPNIAHGQWQFEISPVHLVAGKLNCWGRCKYLLKILRWTAMIPTSLELWSTTILWEWPKSKQYLLDMWWQHISDQSHGKGIPSHIESG